MFDKKNMLSKLRKAKAKKVLIQVPEGLKTKVIEFSLWLEENGIEAIVSVEPCLGACDLRDREAKQLGCDVLLHIGHNDLGLHAAVPVIYEEYELDFDPVTLLKRNMKKLRSFNSIGLVTTTQYVGSLAKASMELEKNGHKVFVGRSARLQPGQVLGCDYSSAKSIASKVECFLFIGSGRFHPLGLVDRTEKPVFFLDIEAKEMTEISTQKTKIEISRQLRIEKASGLKNFGIFVSTKPGQIDIEKANEIKKVLLRLGKTAFIITADMLTPEKIMGIPIQVLVNTACPRIYDDQAMFGVVMLNPADVYHL